MADVVHSISATILPFPSDAPSSGLDCIFDDWRHITASLRFAGSLRGMSAGQAEEKLRAVLCGVDGADLIADALADLSSALVDLRTAAAELAGVDRLLASAADRVLSEAGI